MTARPILVGIRAATLCPGLFAGFAYDSGLTAFTFAKKY